jgi:glycosyltransferase involved in cell wall biosynthesis
MITVLHVIDSLDVGGAERQLVAMLLRSDRAQYRHVVCVLGRKTDLATALEAGGITVHALGLSIGREAVRAVGRLRGLVDGLGPDVLHVCLYWSAVVGRIVGRVTRTPVLTSLVNTSYEPEWWLDNPRLTPAKGAAIQWLDAFTARAWGTWFVAITEAVKASAVRQLGIRPERVSVIPRGITEEWLAAPDPHVVEETRRALGWQGAFPTALVVGRLVPQKGHRYAIEAMPEVLTTFPAARLAIAGSGYLRGELEALARRLGVEGQVQFLGRRADVPALAAASDLFVFPSLFEGFGCALAEAMAAGKPSVASRLPALEEVTDGGRVARLVAARSPAALADAVVQLAKDPAGAARLGQEAMAWARSRYDVHASTRAFHDLFAGLCGGGLHPSLARNSVA